MTKKKCAEILSKYLKTNDDTLLIMTSYLHHFITLLSRESINIRSTIMYYAIHVICLILTVIWLSNQSVLFY